MNSCTRGAGLARTLPPEWVERLNQALFSSPEDAKLLEDPGHPRGVPAA
ncbi:hypothetical protein ACPA9J_17875 [Pseudomonas aeruginosa]